MTPWLTCSVEGSPDSGEHKKESWTKEQQRDWYPHDKRACQCVHYETVQCRSWVVSARSTFVGLRGVLDAWIWSCAPQIRCSFSPESFILGSSRTPAPSMDWIWPFRCFPRSIADLIVRFNRKTDTARSDEEDALHPDGKEINTLVPIDRLWTMTAATCQSDQPNREPFLHRRDFEQLTL